MKMRNANVFYILLFSTLFSESYSLNFRQKLNQAIAKGKAAYKNKFGKDKTWHFLGHDASEYPGTNDEFRKIQADKWEEYYACLKKQESNIGKHGSIIPEAVLALEGESIKLECKVCISPSENSDLESVEWEWSHVDKKYLEPVFYGEHILLSPEDKTLHLYNLGADHVGQYVCKLGQQLTAPYFLSVVNSSEPLKMVHPKKAPSGPYAELPWKIHPDIILDTMWTPWSPCGACGIVSKRHRYGHCLIVLISNLLIDDSNDTSNANNLQEQISDANLIDLTNNTFRLSNIDKELLQIFKFGIPCRSHILPLSLKHVKNIKDRQSEIMIGYCKVKCSEEKVFVVKDKNGNVIESANNSAGIFSMKQGLPPIEPPVSRYLQFEGKGEDIVITCPGNLNTEAPILWQIGSKNVIPALLSQESGGRMFVSITDRIHIKKCRISDSNIYSCWQEKKLAGTVRLVVEKRIKLNFNHHILLIGITIIMSTFLFVYVKAFFGRKYAKQ